ncbi:MAG TPA: DUF4249 domain-containing protein [Mucilaginibacter sp.]
MKYSLYIMFVMLLFSCRKAYSPPVISKQPGYLVVEGIINPGNDSTIIRLAKTVNLNAKNTHSPLINAIVQVESDNGSSYTLTDQLQTGVYSNPGLNLPANNKYRLHIVTSDGKVYASDFMAVKQTPPIDSIGYVLKDSTVNIYLNTHDPANQTRYYRWSYQETWQFTVQEYSVYMVDSLTHSTIVPRPPQDMVFHCFGNNNSSDIVLQSTTNLAQDVVYQVPITAFSIHSERIETKYSILVTQYALTNEEFEFYQNLKKNSESLGSIFDAQPSQFAGNIHNTKDASEPVMGFVSVTSPQSKRVYFLNSIVPPFTTIDYPYSTKCEADYAFYSGINGNEVEDLLIKPPVSGIPLDVLYSGSTIVGYTYSTPACADCTTRGTNKTPAFWK